MDMRQFSAGVVRPEDLHEGPRVEKIINISEKETERYRCAVLEFESGDQLYLWNNQARTLQRAWGYDSQDWIGQELELALGHYTDRKTDPPTEKEVIDVRAISPAKSAADKSITGNGGTPTPTPTLSAVIKRPLADDMDDQIPF